MALKGQDVSDKRPFYCLPVKENPWIGLAIKISHEAALDNTNSLRGYA
jgi:hypothetical protein